MKFLVGDKTFTTMEEAEEYEKKVKEEEETKRKLKAEKEERLAEIKKLVEGYIKDYGSCNIEIEEPTLFPFHFMNEFFH